MLYSFEGAWTQEEKAVIQAAIEPYLVDGPAFNTWLFFKAIGFFEAWRSTWRLNAGIRRTTVTQLTGELTRYYERRG